MLATMFGFSRYPTDQTPGQAVLWWTLTPLTPGPCRIWAPDAERRSVVPTEGAGVVVEAGMFDVLMFDPAMFECDIVLPTGRVWTPDAERRTMTPGCGT